MASYEPEYTYSTPPRVRPHSQPPGSPMSLLSPRDIMTPTWSNVTWSTMPAKRPTTSSFPEAEVRSGRRQPLPPVLVWGREPARLMIGEASRLGETATARFVDPNHWERPIALASPRLSARYRVPLYLPPTSRKGSPPPTRCPPSPRSPRVLNHTITQRVLEERTAGKHLIDAVRRGDVDELKMLVRIRADVNFRGSSFCETALMVAANRGQTNAVRALVAAGADVNLVDKFGSSALHYAAKGGHVSIVHLLVAAGGKHNIVNKHGKTAWDHARGHTQIVVFLETLQKADDARDSLQQEQARALRVHAAATRMQAMFRGKAARQSLRAEADRRELAASLMQAQARGIQVRKNRKLDRNDHAKRNIADWHVVGEGSNHLDGVDVTNDECVARPRLLPCYCAPLAIRTGQTLPRGPPIPHVIVPPTPHVVVPPTPHVIAVSLSPCPRLPPFPFPFPPRCPAALALVCSYGLAPHSSPARAPRSLLLPMCRRWRCSGSRLTLECAWQAGQACGGGGGEAPMGSYASAVDVPREEDTAQVPV